MCPPYYLYTIGSDKTDRTKMGVGDTTHSFDKLLKVFEVETESKEDSVSDSYMDQKLKSINIIDDKSR